MLRVRAVQLRPGQRLLDAFPFLVVAMKGGAGR